MENVGLMFRPIKIGSTDGVRHETAVALIDTGCDETVIKESLAKRLKLKSYGEFRTVSASQHEMLGYYTEVEIRDLKDDIGGIQYVGVSNIPFNSDEGIVAILGVDFLQKNHIILSFNS